LRECKEEIIIKGTFGTPEVLGYINDDIQYDKDTKERIISVGRVHFGVLYAIPTDARVIEPNNQLENGQLKKEIKQGRLMKINELEEICKNPNWEVETWTQIALESIKRLL